MLTDDEFRADPSTQSVLTQIPGFQLSMIRVDCMHCTKLGICHVVIGNSLVWLCGERAYKYLGPAVNEVLGPSASMQEQLDDLMLRFNEYVKDHKIQRAYAALPTREPFEASPVPLVLFCSRADSSPYD